MTTKKAIQTINNLAQLCVASEKGFNVSATNVANRGLKMLLKTFAQQRSQFADELHTEVKRLGGQPRIGIQPLAAIHRGWIHIKAAMTIGFDNTERVVLNEAVRGESVAVRNYQQALSQPLPISVKQLVQDQYERVQKTKEQVELMRGQIGERMVVRLFDTPEDADAAVEALQTAGFERDNLNRVPLDQITTLYEQKHKDQPVWETASAGALVIGTVGAILGLIAGAGAMMIPVIGSMMVSSRFGPIFSTAVAGLLIGLLFGAFLGALIGLGISEDDDFLYDESIKQGHLLLMVKTSKERAEAANRIMLEINAARNRLAAHSQ